MAKSYADKQTDAFFVLSIHSLDVLVVAEPVSQSVSQYGIPFRNLLAFFSSLFSLEAPIFHTYTSISACTLIRR